MLRADIQARRSHGSIAISETVMRIQQEAAVSAENKTDRFLREICVLLLNRILFSNPSVHVSSKHYLRASPFSFVPSRRRRAAEGSTAAPPFLLKAAACMSAGGSSPASGHSRFEVYRATPRPHPAASSTLRRSRADPISSTDGSAPVPRSIA